MSPAAFEPRKTPVQQRSTVTVEAISEATIQVLLAVGLDRLTTTRVAERAGVSAETRRSRKTRTVPFQASYDAILERLIAVRRETGLNQREVSKN